MTNTFGAVMEAIQASEDETVGAMMLAMVQVALPPDDPERLFLEWVSENIGHLPEACEELGVAALEPGPRLAERLKDAVSPYLGVDLS